MSKRKLVIAGAALLFLLSLFVWLARRAVAPEHKDAAQTSQTQQTASFDKKKYPTNDPASIWVVVNKNHSLSPLTYTPSDLTAIGNQQLRKEAAEALQKMFADATVAGYKLSALSGYRSYAQQQTIYNREVAAFGQTVADMESAKPGYSEHQTGFAMDVGGGGCGIEDCFGNTAEGKWVSANAYKYGFIVRYIAGKEAITGYRAEPWHIRYIGTELSNELRNQNIQTLEEFFNL
jgi:zinc D-Ala-D-Ala carboxypeptidase